LGNGDFKIEFFLIERLRSDNGFLDGMGNNINKLASEEVD
jgi:hypothetical protein